MNRFLAGCGTAKMDWKPPSAKCISARSATEAFRRAGGKPLSCAARPLRTPASGQEAVQEEIPPRIIDKLAFYGGVSRMAQQFMTGTGGDYPIMQESAATQEGEILGAQNTAVTPEDLADITTQQFGSKTGSSKPILLTREMIQDSVFDHRGLRQPPGPPQDGQNLEQGVHHHASRRGLAGRGGHLGHGRTHDRRQHGLHLGGGHQPHLRDRPRLS